MKNLKTKNGASPTKLCKERRRKVAMPKISKPKTLAIALATCLAATPRAYAMAQTSSFVLGIAAPLIAAISTHKLHEAIMSDRTDDARWWLGQSSPLPLRPILWLAQRPIINRQFFGPALHKAQSGDMVRLLLKAGANVHARDERNDTALHTPLNADIARALIEAGAYVDARDGENNTVLHTTYDDPEIVRALINAGADVNARDNQKNTVLHLAAYDPEIVHALIDAGADVNARDDQKNTPLHILPDPEAIHALVKHEADTETINQAHQTPLQKQTNLLPDTPYGMCRLGIYALLESGASLDRRGPRDWRQDCDC